MAEPATVRLPQTWPGPGTVLLHVMRGAAGTVGLLLAASIVLFAVVRAAPVDAVDIQMGRPEVTAGLSADAIAAEERERRHELGLDEPMPVQYVRWLERMVRGDWGTSYTSGLPVRQELMARLPASVGLALSGFVIALVIGAGAALVASRRPGGPGDHLTRLGALGLATVPSFLSGTLLLTLFSETIGYPIAGPATLERLWLPALVIGLSSAPTFSRVLRASLIAEKGRAYAVAAVARGASPSRTMFRHVLRPAISPVLTIAGLSLGALLTGSIITEVVFSWPGVAAYAVLAIESQDYPVVQAYVLLTIVAVVLVNRGVDLIQRLLDPRADARAGAVA